MEKILYSKIIGKGIPLLILHGYFGMGDNWKSHANRFSKVGYEVHLIDQRNHGRSFHSKEFNYNLMVEDLKNYIIFHKLKRVILLGHSMGGKTVMLFAVKNPEIVKKLIVVDISPREYLPHHDMILKGLNSIDFSVHNTRRLVDLELSKYIKEVEVRSFLAKNLFWKFKGQLDFRFNLKSLTKNNCQVGVSLPSQSFFKGDTLFLKGEKSTYITNKDKFLIKKHFPNSIIKTIARSGHWLHAENPEEFYNEVIKILNI